MVRIRMKCNVKHMETDGPARECVQNEVRGQEKAKQGKTHTEKDYDAEVDVDACECERFVQLNSCRTSLVGGTSAGCFGSTRRLRR